MEGDEEDSQRVKLSKQNGMRKSESEEERREMITPALRDALTKQGTAWPVLFTQRKMSVTEMKVAVQ